MPSTGRLTGTFDWTAWDVAVPPTAARRHGLSMAGFRSRDPAPADIAMVPHPRVTLLLDLSEGRGLGYDAQGRHEHGSVVVGLAPSELRSTNPVGTVLEIRLEPVAAAALLGPSAAHCGTVVPLEDVWGREAARAEERLRAAGSWNERFTTAAELLTQRLMRQRTRPSVEREVAHAWRRTLSNRGRVRVDRLAEEVGWSRTRLSTRFRSQLGITPKRAARLVRFDHAAHLLATGHAAAGVAAASGYVDQSHLHHDVREFSGLTPTELAVAPWLAIDDLAWPASAAPLRPRW